jgi:hypothetical protein
MAQVNNVAAINHVKLQQIKSDHKTMGLKPLAKKYGIGYAAAKNAVEAKNLKDFRAKMAAYYKAEAEAARKRRQNQKAKEATADQIVETANVYTPEQTKRKLDAVEALAQNNSERLDTVVSLLIGGDNETDDNVITRLARLEGRKSWLRRFLDKF